MKLVSATITVACKSDEVDMIIDIMSKEGWKKDSNMHEITSSGNVKFEMWRTMEFYPTITESGVVPSLDEAIKWLNSDEGVEATMQYFDNIQKKKIASLKQVDAFYVKTQLGEIVFRDFVEKVISKYNSKEYRDRHYNRNVEPPEDLYWFLASFAEKFGREATQEEYERYGNMFVSEMNYYDGYFFMRMDGQGSVIKVVKE